MKLWSGTFLSHFKSSSTSLARAFRVQRSDGVIFGWTEHHEAFILDGITYNPSTGLSVSGTQTTDTMAVPTIDVTAFLDVSTESEILAGIWDSAVVTMFEVNYKNIPVTFDVTRLNILRYGRLGRISFHDNVFQAEVLGLGQALDTHIGQQYVATCPWTLGDARCSAAQAPFTPLNIANYTFAGVVSAVVSGNPRLKFSAIALTQHNGEFNMGTLAFTSGANANLPRMDIRNWENKQFTMQRPLPYPVAVGDTFSAILGDDKTFATCKNKFNNVSQFRGFHYVPGIDALLENPIQWATRPVEPDPPDDNPDNRGDDLDDGGDGE